MAWNSLVYASMEALEHWDDEKWLTSSPTDSYPAPVEEAVKTIRNVVANSKNFRMGDARANIIEPQLGYLLRNLEVNLGEGLGAGHSLLAIYEIEKHEERSAMHRDAENDCTRKIELRQHRPFRSPEEERATPSAADENPIHEG